MLLATLSNLVAKDAGVAFVTQNEDRLGQVVDAGVAALQSARLDERLGASALLLNLSLKVALVDSSGEGPSRAAVTMLLGTEAAVAPCPLSMRCSDDTLVPPAHSPALLPAMNNNASPV